MDQTRETDFTQQPLPIEMDVKIHTIRTGGPVLANASVTLNGCFAVRGLKVMSGSNGPFVSMPSYKAKSGYRDICFPCTREFHQQFHRTVLNAYQQELDRLHSQQQEHNSAAPDPMYREAPGPVSEEAPAPLGEETSMDPAEEEPSQGGMTMSM